ncbi:hypothetical protein J2Z65_001882 [Paenibacillus aceris]|uniref:Uncharacterized protein n=1 Tax=Paenibacillus aceris TaxID=869555 RepID=A0ABS4HVN2_9BACL|nr:hypothetical protein [Paenibacillus aceris]
MTYLLKEDEVSTPRGRVGELEGAILPKAALLVREGELWYVISPSGHKFDRLR